MTEFERNVNREVVNDCAKTVPKLRTNIETKKTKIKLRELYMVNMDNQWTYRYRRGITLWTPARIWTDCLIIAAHCHILSAGFISSITNR